MKSPTNFEQAVDMQEEDETIPTLSELRKMTKLKSTRDHSRFICNDLNFKNHRRGQNLDGSDVSLKSAALDFKLNVFPNFSKIH